MSDTTQMPAELLSFFEASSFCPRDFDGRPGWNTVHCKYEPTSHNDYASMDMYKHWHDCNGVHKATQAFADWGSKVDGEFVQAVIEWFQSMCPATQQEKHE